MYTIEFDTNNGETFLVANNGKSMVSLPAIADKSGHVFVNWYYDSLFTKVFNENDLVNTPIKEDLVLYAKWNPILYTISYQSEGGSHSNTNTYNINDFVSLNDATKPGYCFSGWYEGDLQISQIDRGSVGDRLLVAKWEEYRYQINFQSNGGDFIAPLQYCSLESFNLKENVSRIGHRFLGWFMDEDLTIPFVETSRISEDLTLYAKWQVNTYTIFFNPTSFIFNNLLTFNFGEEINIPPVIPPGGTGFSGWFIDPSYEQPFNLRFMPNYDFSLYGRVGTDLFSNLSGGTGGGGAGGAGGAGGVGSGNVNDSDETPPTSNESSETTSNDNLTSSDSPSENESEEDENSSSVTFTTTFVTNGGSLISAITVSEGESRSLPGDPVREGFTFVAWYLDPDFTDESSLTGIPQANVTLYAKWNVNQYNIEFDSRGGSEVQTINQDFQTTLTAPTPPIREGYSFSGWYRTQNLTGTEYEFTTMPAENILLYAKWTANSYSLTFNSAGGSLVSTITQTFETSVSAPQPPNRTGYTFLGWFINSTTSDSYQFVTMPAQNISLTARWRINQYTITFESRAGSNVSPITLDFNSEIGDLPIPERDGFSFGGWYVNPELTSLFNGNVMPSNDIVLYAKWD
jgi:uncharacterized repeat protein (TIGR02543 family)